MNTTNLLQSTVFVAIVTTMLGVGCRKQEEQPQAMQPQPQYQQYPQQQYQPVAPPQQPYTPQQTATSAPPSGGVPCQADTDLQCPFAKCINGKCGPCSSNDHCKSGSSCSQTPLGMQCVPAGIPGTTPTSQ